MIPSRLHSCLLFLFAFLAVEMAAIPLPAQSSSSKKWRVAMILPGPISDNGYNAGGYAGLMLIKKDFGAEVTFSESTPMANYERVARSFAEDGNDIVIFSGLEFADVARKIAPDYPKQYFLVIDADNISGPNICSIRGKSEDAAFLCGVVAGLTTKSNKIGAIIGFDYPLLVAQTEAFRLGARSVNPKSVLTVTYLGTFDDPSKGKEATLAQINAGVDVIYHIADNAGRGVIQACEEKGIKAIGWGIDQNPLAPKTVITSELVNSAHMMEEVVKLIVDGKFTGHAIISGFDTGGVGLGNYRGLVPASTAAEVEKWKAALIAGTIHPAYTTKRDGSLNEPPVMLPTAANP